MNPFSLGNFIIFFNLSFPMHNIIHENSSMNNPVWESDLTLPCFKVLYKLSFIDLSFFIRQLSCTMHLIFKPNIKKIPFAFIINFIGFPLPKPLSLPFEKRAFVHPSISVN